jgi:hypothetical protein
MANCLLKNYLLKTGGPRWEYKLPENEKTDSEYVKK